MEKTKDEHRLDIAVDLEMTVKQGDFMNVLERIAARRLNGNKPKRMLTFSNLDTIAFFDSGRWKVGDRIEMMLSLPVDEVLQGRPVTPQEVVELFWTNAGPSRSIAYEEIPGWGKFFRLTQRYTGDLELYDRIKRVRENSTNEAT